MAQHAVPIFMEEDEVQGRFAETGNIGLEIVEREFLPDIVLYSLRNLMETRRDVRSAAYAILHEQGRYRRVGDRSRGIIELKRNQPAQKGAKARGNLHPIALTAGQRFDGRREVLIVEIDIDDLDLPRRFGKPHGNDQIETVAQLLDFLSGHALRITAAHIGGVGRGSRREEWGDQPQPP